MEAQNILQDIYFVLLYGGVIMLSVVAAVYLLFRRGNAIAPEVKPPLRLRRWAAAFLIACAFSRVLWAYYAFHPSPALYEIVCDLDLLILFPSITGILVSMLQDRYRPVWPMLVALIPAFVLSALCIIRGDDALFLPLSIYVYALYGLLMIFIFFAVRRYGRWLKDNYADLENKEVWSSVIILALFLLFFVMYNATEGSSVLVYLLQIDCIIIVGLLLWRVETLPELTANAVPEAEREKLEQEQKQKASKMDSLLKKHCENKQLYLQNDLTLAQLAGVIGTNRTYLSQHFAQKGITYNAYINGLRIRHFVRLYEKAVADGRAFTAQQLSSESGYRSYSTFSSTFKQIMGTTVTEWMHSAGK